MGSTTAWKNTKPTAALIAPSTVREPERDDEHDPRQPELGHEVAVDVLRPPEVHVGHQQPAAQPRDRGRQRERDDPSAPSVDPDRRGRDLAAAHRVERAAGRAAAHPDHHGADEGEDDQRQHEIRLVTLAEVDRADHRAGYQQDLGAGRRPNPVAGSPGRRRTRTRAWPATRRCRRGASSVARATRPPPRRSHAPTTIAPSTGNPSWRRRAAPSRTRRRRERRLAQRDLPGEPRDHRDRQEDDRQDRGPLGEIDPRAVRRGRTGSSRPATKKPTPKMRVSA